MALDVSKLIDNFVNLQPTIDPLGAAHAMAVAYGSYCADAITPAGGGLGPISITAGQAATESQLATLFATQVGTKESSAGPFAAAFAALWPLVVFNFGPPAVGPGVTAPPAGVSALVSHILTMQPVPVASTSLASLCVAIDTMCRTVLVTFPGPVNPIISPVV